MFYRQTAVEGQRRALVVQRFEQERMRRYLPFVPDEVKRNQEELFGTPLDVGPPTLDDLAAVCRDDGVDFIAVTEPFDAPRAADNGHIYIYDCRQVRAALSGRSSSASDVVASSQGGMIFPSGALWDVWVRWSSTSRAARRGDCARTAALPPASSFPVRQEKTPGAAHFSHPDGKTKARLAYRNATVSGCAGR